MQQRIGFAHTVAIGSSLDLEAHPKVEAYRLFVLFVDVDGPRAENLDRMGDQRSAHALATRCRIDEQHFNPVVGDPEEPDDHPAIVARRGQRHRGQEFGYQALPDPGQVGIVQEAVGRAHAGLPHRSQPRVIEGASCADAYRGCHRHAASNKAMDSTWAVWGNMSMTPAAWSFQPRSLTR